MMKGHGIMVRYSLIISVCFVVSLNHVWAAERLTLTALENDYLEAQIPTAWSFQVVGGKDGEMQMSLWIPSDETAVHLSLFAYWGALDPYNYITPGYAVEYSIADKHYYHYPDGAISVIIQGEQFRISLDLSQDLPDRVRLILLTIIPAIRAK
jgi:hypothetical protein